MSNIYNKPSGQQTNPELLAAVSNDASRAAGTIIEIHKDSIIPDPDQPRKVISEDVILERKLQLESEGQLSPITVWPAENMNGKLVYKLLDGECRWRGALLSETVNYLRAEITVLDPSNRFKILTQQLLHNDDGSQALSNVERAAAYYELVNESKEKGSENPLGDVARALGKQASEVSRILSLVDLPKSVIDFSLKNGIDDPKVLGAFKQTIKHGDESDLSELENKVLDGLKNNESLRAITAKFTAELKAKSKNKKSKPGKSKRSSDKKTRQLNVRNIVLDKNTLVVETPREIIKLKMTPEQITQLLTR